jgi:hypothetical protein
MGVLEMLGTQGSTQAADTMLPVRPDFEKRRLRRYA